MHAVAKVHKCEMRSFSWYNRYQLQATSLAILFLGLKGAGTTLSVMLCDLDIQRSNGILFKLRSARKAAETAKTWHQLSLLLRRTHAARSSQCKYRFPLRLVARSRLMIFPISLENHNWWSGYHFDLPSLMISHFVCWLSCQPKHSIMICLMGKDIW